MLPYARRFVCTGPVLDTDYCESLPLVTATSVLRVATLAAFDTLRENNRNNHYEARLLSSGRKPPTYLGWVAGVVGWFGFEIGGWVVGLMAASRQYVCDADRRLHVIQRSIILFVLSEYILLV
jgi:hypothetical protein